MKMKYSNVVWKHNSLQSWCEHTSCFINAVVSLKISCDPQQPVSVHIISHHVQQSARSGCTSQTALDSWRDGQ